MAVYPSKDIDREAAGNARAAGSRARKKLPPRAEIAFVAPESPADDAGFEPGCFITTVDGEPVRDLIDWRWLSAEDEITVGYIDLDGEAGEVDLFRDEGEDWGFEFDGVVFDGVKQCRNACIFCFMRQLPDDMRASLTLRDDDFRLSFLAGTFVTFTNLSTEDEARIIGQHISPLRVSLHASNPEVRRRIIGKHAAHGIEVLDRLLAAGIEFHAQIVLMPDENDGEVLRETLGWAYARPGILDVCIVPLGFTKHQTCFTKSFDDPDAAYRAMAVIKPVQERALAERGTLWAFAADEFYCNAYGDALLEHLPPASCYGESAAALAVLEQLRPFQQRALGQRGTPWVFGADEFYLNAYGSRVLEELPPAPFYGDFEMFEDGVGIVRSFADDWRRAVESGADAVCAQALRKSNVVACLVFGYATRGFAARLVGESAVAGLVRPLFVKNDFFGGNVDVTGLLCGCDIVRAIRDAALGKRPLGEPASLEDADSPAPSDSPLALFCIPRVVFNDDGVTLDDMTLADIEKAAGAHVAVVSCNGSEFLPEIARLAADLRAKSFEG